MFLCSPWQHKHTRLCGAGSAGWLVQGGKLAALRCPRPGFRRSLWALSAGLPPASERRCSLLRTFVDDGDLPRASASTSG